MNIQMYCIWDKKAELFMAPMYYHNDGVMCRSVAMQMPKMDLVEKYPEDYAVFHVGRFDDVEGSVVGHVPPRLVVECTALVAKADVTGRDKRTAAPWDDTMPE